MPDRLLPRRCGKGQLLRVPNERKVLHDRYAARLSDRLLLSLIPCSNNLIALNVALAFICSESELEPQFLGRQLLERVGLLSLRDVLVRQVVVDFE